MQEIRSWKTRLSKLVNNLKSDCRWMLSGTPLLDDVTDLRGELCFLGLEPFCATNDDGFFDFAVANHWHHKSQYGLSILRKLAELIMLRRSKSMLIRQTELPLLGLKPFTLTFEPIAQDPSERALYCFFEFLMHSTVVSKKEQQLLNADDIENETNRSTQRKLQEQQRHKNAFLRILRELCVSPTLLNGGLGVPSQLDMLNRWMKDYNRHRQGARTMDQDTEQTMSCDEAVRFLSQVVSFRCRVY